MFLFLGGSNDFKSSISKIVRINFDFLGSLLCLDLFIDIEEAFILFIIKYIFQIIIYIYIYIL